MTDINNNTKKTFKIIAYQMGTNGTVTSHSVIRPGKSAKFNEKYDDFSIEAV